MEDGSEKLAALRRSLASVERIGGTESVSLGHAAADALLGGGLRVGSLHEIYAENGSHAAAATAFATGLALRVAHSKRIFWITTDFANLEHGSLNATGLLELGLNPMRLFTATLARGDNALRAASDILACGSVGALVLELHGAIKALDLTASRRLSFAAAQKNVTTILLRLGAKPEASSAETRWLVNASASPPIIGDADWGLPRFDVQLVRHRHGELGQWRMSWDCDNRFFRDDIQKPSPHYGGVVSTSADGTAPAAHGERRAS